MGNSPPDPASASSLLGEGKRLGDFELIREIGRGGMGVVYESRQTSLNRRVALKILPPGLGLTDVAVRRFEREAQAAAKLHHTNIVPVHAIGQESGCHFYAMELVDGQSLSEILAGMEAGRSGEPSESTATTSATLSGSSSSTRERFDTVARLVAEVADGLHYASTPSDDCVSPTSVLRA
jgi:serine/threonine protein kinase